MHCDHTVLVSVDIKLWLDSPMYVLGTLTPKHVHLFPVSFSSSTWKRGGVWMCKLGMTSQEQLKIDVNVYY